MNVLADQASSPVTLEKLSGCISSYRKTRGYASFVFNDKDRSRMGAIAVASALIGEHGQAAIMSHNAASTEEEADYVEFTLDGNEVKGWLWRSPFQAGDRVVAAVGRQGDRYELFGMMRPEDGVIALYPHCSRGRLSHIRNAAKWYGYLLLFIMLCVGILGFIDSGKPFDFWFEMLADPYLKFIPIGFLGVFFVMVMSLAWKWMPFVRLSERVLKVLGLPNPSNIDLVRSTKKLKTKDDPPECGHMYFKY
ncbi:putative type VI secretion system effector [Herbaspirillum robiniae]|uniref:putative type VI secretion system effector n=1 Tax=Herbaspirillum robiniae TaxID=2014887 RepID=UPI003D774CA9